MPMDEMTKVSRGGGAVVEFGQVSDRLEDVESFADAEAMPADEKWTFWEQQIKAGLVAENRFREEGVEAERAYFGDEDKAYTTTEYKVDEHKMNVLHANTEVLKPILFSDVPDPIVRRRFGGDGNDNDPTDRLAAIVAERMASYLIETTNFEESVKAARDDWLTPGRGTVRVMYQAEFEDVPQIDPITNMAMVDPETGTPITQKAKRPRSEKVKVRHWPWRRTVYSPANTWDDLEWMAFETPMNKTKVTRRFGAEVAEAMNYPNSGLRGLNPTSSDAERTGYEADKDAATTKTRSVSASDECQVFEIWDKESRKVIWWSPDYTKGILEELDDPLHIEDFWNTPRPLLAITKNGMLTPRPYTAYYKARADEIDVATRKLMDILEKLALVGFYPGAKSAEVDAALKGKSKLISIEEWVGFLDKGGARELIQWLPIEQMVNVANALILMREQSKAALYEISGISDIVRGSSNPNETLGAQKMKGNYANIRLMDKQRTIALFARDTIRIMIEVALEHFDTETIASIVNMDAIPATDADLESWNTQIEAAKQQHAMATQLAQQGAQAGLQVQPPPPLPDFPFFEQTSWERIHTVLRDDLTRKFTLSIETDQTILQDQEADKQARVEFLTAFSQMAQNLLPMVQGGIIEMKLIKELLLFAVRGFPKAKTLEGMVSNLPDKYEPQEQTPVQVQVAQIKAEADKLLEETQIAADAQAQASEQQHDMRMAGVKMMADTLQAEMNPKTPPQRSAAR